MPKVIIRNENGGSGQGGYTLIELLAVIFIISVSGVMEEFVAKKYGRWPGIGAGILGGAGALAIVVQFYRWTWRRKKRRLLELSEKYRNIYRVIVVPTGQNIIKKPHGAEIRVSDYGWEAGPILKNDLVYLQGLTSEWRVVWHAGFRPHQIEKICLKPSSQYDYWVPDWVKNYQPIPCPFPVQNRETPTMGLPHYTHKYYNAER